jgi:hypothetical protein
MGWPWSWASCVEVAVTVAVIIVEGRCRAWLLLEKAQLIPADCSACRKLRSS